MAISALQNRYWRVCIYCLALLFTNVLHAGWLPMVRYMRDSGKFAWLCSPDSIPDPVSGFLCQEQDNAFSLALAVVSACDFSTAVFAGALFDIAGPRWTAVLGQILILSSLPLVSYSTSSGGMYAGFALMGLCAYFTGFPAMAIAADFPGNETMAITMVMGIQYGTSLVYAILYEWGSAWGIDFTRMTMYYWVFILPIGLLYCLSLPSETRAQIEAERAGSDFERSSIKDVWSPNVRKYLRTPEWLVCCVWQCLTFFAHTMLVNNMLTWGGEEVSNFYGYFYVASIASTFFWGWVGKLTSISLMLNVVSLGYILSFGFSYGDTPWDYAAAVANCLMGSYFFNAKSVWTNQIFPPEFMGRLLGIAATIVGLFTLAAVALLGRYGNTIWLGSIVLSLITACSAFLAFRDVVMKVNYRESPTVLTSLTAASTETVTSDEV